MVAVMSSPGMGARSRDGERQVHPDGDLVTVEKDFRDRIRVELVARNWSQADLARALHVPPGTITGLLNGDGQIRIYDRIIKLFGWADTRTEVTATPVDDGLKRLTRKWPKLDDADRAIVAALVDSLSAKR